MIYTPREIEEAVEPNDHLNPDAWDGGWNELAYEADGQPVEILIGGEMVTVTMVAGQTGGEGSAEDIWLVIKIGEQYFKKTGWYASSMGSNWEGDLKEVRPVERMTTYYE